MFSFQNPSTFSQAFPKTLLQLPVLVAFWTAFMCRSLSAFARMQSSSRVLHMCYDADAKAIKPNNSMKMWKSIEPRELKGFCRAIHSPWKTFRTVSRVAILSGSLLASYRTACVFESQHAYSGLRAASTQVDVECQFGARAFATVEESQNNKDSFDLRENKTSMNKDDDELLRKAIAYEAERGFPNCLGRKLRFSDFLSTKLSALSSANSSQGDQTLTVLANSAERYENMSIPDRVSLIDKVCGLLGFQCVQDLLDHHTAVTEASRDLHVDVPCVKGVASSTNQDKANGLHHETWPFRNGSQSLMLQRFSHPSIVFGSSERIELYNPTDEENGMMGLSSVTESQGTSSGRRQEANSANDLITESSNVFEDNGDKAPVDIHLHESSELEYSKREPLVQRSEQEKGHASQPKKRRKSIKKAVISDTYESWLLNKPITLVKSLSSYLCSKLDEHGFYTLRQLLQHYPRTYLYFQQAGQIVENGQYLTFFGTIISSRGYVAGSLGILEVVIASAGQQESGSLDQTHSDTTGKSEEAKHPVVLHAKKFFRGVRFANNWFLSKIITQYPRGAYAAISGKVKAMDQENHFELKEFNLELYDPEDESELEAAKEKPYPVYPAKGGLDAKTLELCIQKVLPDLPLDIDPLPERIRKNYNLLELREAYAGIHCPTAFEVAEKARQRLVFDEFLYLQLNLLLQRQQLADGYLEAAGMQDSAAGAEGCTLDMEKWAPLTVKFLRCLPFSLTKSQIKAASEIMWDLQRPIPMSRLLQGDVGCGKTIVAFLALLEVIDAGFQAALMGPTEFLARQHYELFVSYLERMDIKDRPQIALLTSSVPASKARAIRKGLECGEIQLAIGTQSLISDSVKFAALGLAVIDEQHRFGVAQRIRLNNKGVMMSAGEPSKGTVPGDLGNEENGSKIPIMRAPHLLAMSATPIPRSLALAIHGDMDFGQITELPPGRLPVKTCAILGDKTGLKTAFQMVHAELKKGGRAFIVYPIIGESEELPNLKAASVEFEKLVKEFEGYRCGLVHGKLKSNEKEEVMSSFKSGKTQVLVSTSVVEVGIDIPEASIMVVVHAERYGMAQLHQLRGRVGRGSRKSTCVLLGSSLLSLQRLKILEESWDGFHLAEIDLKSRGPGDLLGKQQSGHPPEFSLARLEEDGELMIKARTAAEDLLCEFHGLEGLPRLKQELSFRRAPNLLGI